MLAAVKTERLSAFPGTHAPRDAAPPARRRERGFTIMEVTMATFVMALGIATSIIALQTGFKQIDVARGDTLAAQIMQSEIERLRLLSWTAITALDGEQKVDLSTMFTSNAAIVSKYTVVRTVKADDARPSDVRNITLTVTWSSYDGRSHSRTFTTIYAKNGLYDYYYTLAKQ
jgi:Tfp pilus assembly protein PilV